MTPIATQITQYLNHIGTSPHTATEKDVREAMHHITANLFIRPQNPAMLSSVYLRLIQKGAP